MRDFSPTGLPLVPYLPQISKALAERRGLILCAEPGAGKSTLVPPALMDEPWLAGRSIIMLEPRRLAAMAVAQRIAELLGEPVGGRAGYAVRTSSRASRDTRILVVTEALLTRRIQEDPLLDGIGLVILDEFHERSIHADLALALSIEVRRARPDLAVLVMSATVEAEPVASLLGAGEDGPVPTLTCPGRQYPVETRYAPLPAGDRWEEGFADGVARLFDETEGDILAFLPGAGEIRRVGARLAGRLGQAAEVLPLHGTMRLEDQARVIRPAAASQARESGQPPDTRRRVVIATSIAETSLTVPGIRTVADSGWARLSRFHAATGMDRLVTERVSVSSAEQRRGRAGRLGPGLCVRFWPQSDRLLARPDPEMLRSDLSGLVLECALWGARARDALRWLDPPPAFAWSHAEEVLRMLALVDAKGATDLGRSVSRMGLAPRLGVLVHLGRLSNELPLAAACAALLEERDGSRIARDPDFRLRLEMIRTGTGGDESWRRAVAVEMERILRRTSREGQPREGQPGGGQPGGGQPRAARAQMWSPDQEERAGNLLAFSFPDRIARREPDGAYRLVTGRMLRFPGSAGGSRPHDASRAAAAWIAAPEADPGETTGLIRLAAPVDREEVDRVLSRAAEETREIRWEGLVPKGALVRRVGRLVLTERPVRPEPQEIRSSFSSHLQKQGLAALPWNARTRSLLARLRFCARARPQAGLGDMAEEALVNRADEWLGPFLNLSGGQLINAGALQKALHAMAAAVSARFDAEVPEWLVLPTGGKRAIDYEGEAPALEARIQEVFGLSESPRVLGVPVAFRLLSPASRPVQITSDLAGFWRTTYAEVRKELRGRYPKHYWPEDPLQAEPTSRVRPGGNAPGGKAK